MIETVDDIKTIANVGTGTMGHAITLQFALSGYPVHLVGRGEASLEKAMKAIRSDAEDFAEAGLLKDGDTLDAVLARITGYADYASGVADVDFVIESMAENLDIKKSVWAEVEHAAPQGRDSVHEHLRPEPHRAAVGAEEARTLRGGALLEPRAVDAAGRSGAG